MRCSFRKRPPFLYTSTQTAAPEYPRRFPPPPARPSADRRRRSNGLAVYLQRAKLIDSIRLHLRTSSAPPLPSAGLDSVVAVHSIRSAPSPESAIAFFEKLKSISDSSAASNGARSRLLSKDVVHAVAKRLALAGRLPELRKLVEEMDSGEFFGVLAPALMDRLKWFAAAGDVPACIALFDRICEDADSSYRRHPCTESYNVMMDIYVKGGQVSSAFSLFSRMIDEGALPNSRTYTIVIEHLIGSGKLDAAMKVFDKLPKMRIRRTARQYSDLVDAFSAIESHDVVLNLLSEMRRDGILPGRSLYLAVLKLKEAGFVSEVEDVVRGLEPDDRIGTVGGFLVSNGDDEDGEDETECAGRNGRTDEIRLKPWLDPSALASSLSDWGRDEVSMLEAAGFVWTSRLVCKVLRGFRKSDAAWKFFYWVAMQPGKFVHDVYTVSRIIAVLARDGSVERVNCLIAKIKREGIYLSFSTLALVIDSYGLSKNGDAALAVFRQVGSICGKLSKFHMSLLYSSLLRSLVKCGRSSDAMHYLDEMILLGVMPDIQTFCGLMQFFALEGDPRAVQQLIGTVRQCRMDPDAYMYQILIRTYCKKKMPALALRMFDDMWIRGLRPDVVTKDLLANSLWKDGKLREATRVEEMCEEVGGDLLVAVPGHEWTVSFHDLNEVRSLYGCMLADVGEICK